MNVEKKINNILRRKVIVCLKGLKGAPLLLIQDVFHKKKHVIKKNNC